MKIRSFVEARAALEPYMVVQSFRQVSPAQKLSAMRQLLNCIGNPQEQFKTIHVAGTSGKTSTAYYAASLLHHAGMRVGLTISPHTVEMNDRVQIDGVPLPEDQFCTELGIFLELIKDLDVRPTYFELMVAFAWWEFVRKDVVYAVVEVGIGGLYDSTNTIARSDKVAIITDIGMDHIAILGPTLQAIAQQKAGIIQQGNVVFLYAQAEEIMQQILARSQEKQADIHILSDAAAVVPNSTLPPFQQRNAALALSTIRYIAERDAFTLTEDTIACAMAVHIPGRMEVFAVHNKTIILDGAHNMQKIAALCASVSAHYPGKSVVGLVGIVDSREGKARASEVLFRMSTICDAVIVTQFGGTEDGPHRGVSVEELLRIARQQGIANAQGISDPKDAFSAACARDNEIVLVAGSFYLLNHIRPMVLKAAI